MFKLVNKEMVGTFRFSIIAGEVCSTLDLLKARQSFQTRDEKVLNHAIQFLSSTQEGKCLAKSLELNERAFDALEAYGETIRVLRTIYADVLEVNDKILENIVGELKSSLEEIKKEKGIVANKKRAHERLRKFFSIMRQLN